ncbi:MAG: serine/threonine-protein kinase, partial [Cyanobacteriota bacterium]|nr:serine/threonine-protein kinase [Cyanobacteriota bacterium]
QIPSLLAYFSLEAPDWGTLQNQQFFYIVQEYIEGQDLEEELEAQGQYSEEQVREILQEVLNILDFIHDQNVIHRDIKPSNIMRDRKGRLYLLDFGAVKQITQQAKTSGKSTGIYSIGYAPPEQVRGYHVFPSTDLYALAVTCIVLLTGKEPEELFDSHNDRWNWRKNAQVSNSLAEILDQMLLPTPSDRFTSAQKVLNALNPGSTVEKSVTTPLISSVSLQDNAQLDSPTASNTASKKPQILVLATTILLGLIGVGVWGFTQFQGGSDPSSSQTSLSASQSQAQTFAQVPKIPTGLFSHGGSTTWVPIRESIDSKIQTVWPQFKLRYIQHPTKPPSSTTGIYMLLNDQLAFSESSRPLKAKEKEQAQQKGFEIKEIPIAIDAIAVAINPQINIQGLTVMQLRDIYLGRITNWQEVGGPDIEITPYSRSSESGTVDFFLENILEGQELAANIEIIKTTTLGIRKVANNLGGIYFASAPEIVGQCDIKAIAIGLEPDQLIPPYQEPLVPPEDCPNQRNQLNQAAFQSGEYPITRRLYVIIKQNGQIDQEAGEAYANLLLTPQGQDLVEQAGYTRIKY